MDREIAKMGLSVRNAVAALAFVICASSQSTQAAQFRVLPDFSPERAVNRSQCALFVEGQFEPGDNERLKTTLGERHGGKGTPLFACLHSGGGNFSEAIEIAKTFIDRQIATIIPPNATCLSACAIVFMSGLTSSTSGAEFSRHMHVTSKLGFHAPAPRLAPGANFDGDDLQAAYADAIDAIGRDLLSLARYRNRAWSTTLIKPTLINEMMTVHGNNFFYIDTVGKAAEFGIQLDGVPLSAKAFGIDDARAACKNAVAHVADSALGDWFAEIGVEKIGTVIESDRKEYAIDVQRQRYIYCTIASWGGGDGQFPQLNIKVNTSSAEHNVFMDGYFVLPGETPLVSLAHPNFDAAKFAKPTWCQSVTLVSEATICGSRDLTKLEDKLVAAYAKRLSTSSPNQKKRWQDSQKVWLRTRDACDKDYVCLHMAYVDRIAQIKYPPQPYDLDAALPQ